MTCLPDRELDGLLVVFEGRDVVVKHSRDVRLGERVLAVTAS